MFLSLLYKGNGSKEISVISQSHGRHTQLHRSFHQSIHATTPVQQTKVRMNMQMYEILIFVTHLKKAPIILRKSFPPLQGNLAHVHPAQVLSIY